ncbi:ABC transporter transmembrane domain-containing protein [Parasedimentitalea huanghaiensis]|uniref:Cyclic nucleotide-binding domain-containing protein n=1 Tax=Parasedimentitalea huanghaiensis TaxID=2682100 RepID=A0A6L6WAY8_9RHOB|nr:ABC transporter transmembrane domain-containing protein [Zongyanglinia huanghaiensis]MVO14973.1 cyclic nucleotide-binding domain-containing protein [Zongyanglinia huanghaiensis]
MVLLLVTTTLFPLLFLTLELPKRIINDAIGAQTSIIDVLGRPVDQLSYLWLLCGGFLLAVTVHGLMKMRINTMKGVLAERMLRRFRYQLIARVLRFPQPYFERVSQGELVSMITAESEPMGGLMGDAISQPVLQAGQMITILSFLFLQNVWFGLAAVALIPLQGWLIPMLQRRINLLNKKRIKQVRALAAEIGESAAGASTLRINGGWRYRMAVITARLGRLYDIRLEIYQKKFFMKFLNNFITQLTPFLFYAIGGYLVLQGSVSLGALVAALAAYKDLASPWKELLAYYNQTQDMSLRWDVIMERFAPAGMVDETLMVGEPDDLVHLKGDVVLDSVNVRDADGNLVLEDLSARLPAGKVVGIAAPSEEDRRAMAELLTRELLPSVGTVSVAGHDLSKLHQAVIAARIGHATSRPVLFQGSFGDNVMMPMRPRPSGEARNAVQFEKAKKAGNSPDPHDAPWLDPSLAGFTNEGELRDWWLKLVEGIGSETALFRRGMEQRFDPKTHPILSGRLVKVRAQVQQAVRDAGLLQHTFLLKPDQYNPALPVAENLLYATPHAPITETVLAEQTDFLDLIKELNLDEDLVALTQDVVDMLRQIFGLDGTDHPLFRKLGLEPSAYEAALALVEKTRSKGADVLDHKELAQLLIVPFRISAEQIGPAFSEDMQSRILTFRQSHSTRLMATLGDLFVPLNIEQFAPGLTVMENALFGKISDLAGAKGDELRKLVAELLVDQGVRDLVVELIFDLPIALGGQGLAASFAEPLAFSRATVKRPDILILDSAMSSYDLDTRISVHKNLRRLLPDTTLIYLSDSFESPEVFDVYYELRQGRLVTDEVEDAVVEDGAASADLARKLRALEQTELFSGLNRRQLRLLAFSARWYQADVGEVVFLKDDEASDGAYMILEGEAGLYLPAEGQADRLIATVGPGRLVGELGLIRKEPRSLSMIAQSDLTCLRIGEEEFFAVVENDAATAFKLLQVVAGYVSN